MWLIIDFRIFVVIISYHQNAFNWNFSKIKKILTGKGEWVCRAGTNETHRQPHRNLQELLHRRDHGQLRGLLVAKNLSREAVPLVIIIERSVWSIYGVLLCGLNIFVHHWSNINFEILAAVFITILRNIFVYYICIYYNIL